MKKERPPTEEEFNKLLLWFHPDRDTAADLLAKTQTRLIQIFTSRRCYDAEEMMDEVINRVAVRINTVVNKFPNAAHCCLAFVDNVYREWLRDEKLKNSAREPPKPRPTEVLEQEDQCLAKCLKTLEKSDREIFERYFAGEGRARIDAREQLAKEKGFTANGLRIKAHRLRKRMRLCIEECLSE